jgi:(4S)-4-hydroxy-5-phosphonooxypentane-2,3-dione isomerase
MRITKVTMRIRPEKTGLYEETFLRLRDRVLAEEEGCAFFELCRDPGEGEIYHVLEAYADEAAVEEHVQTPYYKETARIFVECLQGDHMAKIKERGLEGRAMYQVVEGIQFERLETV